MSGLLRRLTRRRPATADETGSATPESSEPAGAPADTPAEPGGDRPVPAASEEKPAAAEDKPAAADEQATQVLPATGEQPTVLGPQPTVVATQPAEAPQPSAPVRDLPAGVDPSELAGAPIASARRGKLRRRLRYLRAVRDLLLRDLGGFTYEIERSAAGKASETHRRLIEAKTNRIAALDGEVRGLESRLGEPHAAALLREPGIGGTCPECGELHASDAHYCARCGAPLDAKARARRDAAVAAAARQTTGSHPTAESAPASGLWAAGPRPDGATERDENEDTHPSLATSQWLALRPHGGAEKAEPAAKGAEPPADESAPAAEASTTAGADAPATTTDEPGADAEAPVAKADESAAAEEGSTTGTESAAGADVPAAKADEPATGAEAPVAKADAPVTGAEAPATGAEAPAAKADEPAAKTDEPVAKADEPVAKADEPVAGPEQPAEAPADEIPERPSERTALWLGVGQAAASDAPKDAEEAKPKRPRASRAKKPAADTGEAAAAKPKRTRAKKPAPAPELPPETNGRRDEPVSPPEGDPLTSRPEQGS